MYLLVSPVLPQGWRGKSRRVSPARAPAVRVLGGDGSGLDSYRSHCSRQPESAQGTDPGQQPQGPAGSSGSNVHRGQSRDGGRVCQRPVLTAPSATAARSQGKGRPGGASKISWAQVTPPGGLCQAGGGEVNTL